MLSSYHHKLDDPIFAMERVDIYRQSLIRNLSFLNLRVCIYIAMS